MLCLFLHFWHLTVSCFVQQSTHHLSRLTQGIRSGIHLSMSWEPFPSLHPYLYLGTTYISKLGFISLGEVMSKGANCCKHCHSNIITCMITGHTSNSCAKIFSGMDVISGWQWRRETLITLKWMSSWDFFLFLPVFTFLCTLLFNSFQAHAPRKG